MSGVDPQKLLELYDKNKTYFHLVSAFVAGVLCFLAGVYSVDCPPKEVVCKAEIATKEKLFDQLKDARDKHIQEIRKVHDEEQAACKVRVDNAIEKYKVTHPAIDCNVCKAIAPQCKRRKTPICK